MKKIARAKALELIKTTQGGFFSATFVKKDSTIRKMVCRIGVRKGVKGNPSTVDRPDTPFKTVWSAFDRQFRVINLETLLSLKIRGQEWEVVDA